MTKPNQSEAYVVSDTEIVTVVNMEANQFCHCSLVPSEGNDGVKTIFLL